MPDLLLTRAAARSTVDVEARSVEAVLASETPVRRRSYTDGTYEEVLRCTPEAVDLSRSDALSLLDSHDAWSLGSRLGTVTNIRFEGRKLVGTLILGKSQRADELLTDLSNGHRIGVSIGYRIEESARAEGVAGGVATVTATRWTFLEASIVAIPADPVAQTRSLSPEDTMPENHETETRHQPNNIISERTRAKNIRELGKRSGMDQVMIDAAIDDGTTVDAFRSAMLDKIVEQQGKAPTFSHMATDFTNGQDGERDARIEALACRMSGAKPSDRAREFMGWTLEQHAKRSLDVAGVNARNMTRDDYFGAVPGFHTVSDFPLLLEGAGHRVLMDAYQIAQSPIRQVLSRESIAADFRAKSSLRVTDLDVLGEISETGEIGSQTRAEVAESYTLKTHASTFNISRKALINDDLGAFSDWVKVAGRAAAETENKVLLDLLRSHNGAGPTMGEDKKSMFHVDHGNIETLALSVEAVSTVRAAFRKVKAPGGKLFASVSPKFLLVGPNLETTAERIVAAITATKTDDVNPIGGKLTVLVEPRLDESMDWYLFADPEEHTVIEHSYLAGTPGPQTAMREGWEVLGFSFRVVLDFGAGVLDWRGATLSRG